MTTLLQARFWYISMVSCKRNVSTCRWEYVPDFPGEISYDIHLVNGNPTSLHRNIFKHQFSSDQQELYPLYLALLLVYTILTPLQFAVSRALPSIIFCQKLMVFKVIIFLTLKWVLDDSILLICTNVKNL